MGRNSKSKGITRTAYNQGKVGVPTGTKAEVMKQVAKNLELYGTPVPPYEAVLMTGKKTCPGCDPEGKHLRPIMKDFGLTKDAKGKTRPQSRCRTCRNSKESHPTRYGLR
jgi:hypothetical protein